MCEASRSFQKRSPVLRLIKVEQIMNSSTRKEAIIKVARLR